MESIRIEVDAGQHGCKTTEYKSTDSLLPPLLNVLREGLSEDSQNIPCATLKRRGSWVIRVADPDPDSIESVDPDPDSMGSVDPDPDSESVSGSRRAKMTQVEIFLEIACF
jgi:hypothetical protein